MDKTYAVWVKHKQGIREKRENKSESHISRFFKNEACPLYLFVALPRLTW